MGNSLVSSSLNIFIQSGSTKNVAFVLVIPVDTIMRILKNSPSQITQGSQRIVGQESPRLGISSHLHQAELCSESKGLVA